MMIKFGPIGASQMALVVNNSLANKEDVRDTGLILGLGRSPGEGQGNPFLFFFFFYFLLSLWFVSGDIRLKSKGVKDYTG